MARKVLIATPIKLGLTGTYMTGLIPTLLSKFPDVEVEHCILEGPSVNFARNECAHYAMKIGARELLFIDDDMGWTLDHFTRIISHADLDIVAGVYCKRRPGKPFWLMNTIPGKEIDPATGLLEVSEIATGFMKIRVDTVLEKMKQEYPDREYFDKPEEGKPVTAWEFFPMGVRGGRSADARLKRVKQALARVDFHEGEFREAVWKACYDEQGTGTLFGEDYYFCQLARECGFRIYADFGMPIIPHVGEAAFPITSEMVGIDTSNA